LAIQSKSKGIKMKFYVAILAGLTFSISAYADSVTEYVSARVVGVEPITVQSSRAVPRTSCYYVEEISRDNSGAVVGAIVGGAAGRAIARDKDTGTAVGAIAGAVIGNQNSAPQSRMVERCTTYHDREYYNRITGYNVTFEYKGQLRTARMSRDPGHTITLKTVTRIFAVE
jgi:uncharacterized protein YcfJ